MLHFPVPSVDEKNPFYCPSVSAASYLQSLRHQLNRTTKSQGKNRRNNRLLESFARVLENALLPGASDSSDDDFFGNIVFNPPFNVNGRSRTPSTSSDENAPNFSYPIPAWELEDGRDFCNGVKGSLYGHGSPLHLKRKRAFESFSDIQGPPKYARSIQSVHDTSFDVSVKHEKLSYSGGPASLVKTKAAAVPRELRLRTKDDTSDLALKVRDLEGQLYGPPIGTESPRGIHSLIERLDSILPGIRLKDRLSQQSRLSHQSLVDFLGINGYLNARVLAVFRTSEIRWITLTESLADTNGLNLGADILPSFSQPNSFFFLSELSLRDIAVHDFDMNYIQRLPKLSTLLLDNTSISNEAIFLLVPLKRSLTQLSIGSNPGIDDDAVPALLLSKLSFLSILDTSIHMPGVRRLARTIYNEDRIIDIEIPTACEDYVNDMHNRYALDPRPPLITDPEVCQQLSAAALQRNLAVHAAKNPNIFAAGGKAEMVERLRALLDIRRMDLLVRDMIRGVEEERE